MELHESVISHVLGHLNINELTKLSLVSKSMYSVVGEEYIWKEIGDNLHLKTPTKRNKYKTWKALVISNIAKMCIDCQRFYSKGVSPYCESCYEIHFDLAIESFEDPEKERICKGDAKDQYGLNDADLENIDHIKKANPMYKYAPPMTLYDHFEVIQAMIKKYGDSEGLRYIKYGKKKYLAKERNAKLQTRKNKLVEKLAKHNVQIDRIESKELRDYLDNGRGKQADIIEHCIEINDRITKITEESNKRNIQLRKCVFNEFVYGIELDAEWIVQKEIDRNNRIKEIDDLFIGQTYDKYITSDYIEKGGNIQPIRDYICRKKLLSDEFDKYGLKIRGDSTICDEYVRHGNRPLHEVVEIMREMDWFFTNTNYSNYMRSPKHGKSKTARSKHSKEMAISRWFSENDSFDPNKTCEQVYEKYVGQTPINIANYIRNEYMRRMDQYNNDRAMKMADDAVIMMENGETPTNEIVNDLFRINSAKNRRKMFFYNNAKNILKMQGKDEYDKYLEEIPQMYRAEIKTMCAENKCDHIPSPKCAHNSCRHCCPRTGCDHHS